MKETPLTSVHRRLGADMGSEAGWVLPRQYRNLIDEHSAARSACGMFDISPLGKFRLQGNGAAQSLDSLLSNDITDCCDGHLQQTLLLRPDGVILDNITLCRESAGRFLLIGSASQADVTYNKLYKLFHGQSLEVVNLTDDYCAIALCGPESEKVFQQVQQLPDFPHPGEFRIFRHGGQRCFLTHAGLVAADSFELFCPASHGIDWFEQLMSKGAIPCGLRTREYLRIQRGRYDITRDSLGLTPKHVGLEKFCSVRKKYEGAQIMQQSTSPDGRLIALKCSEACPEIRIGSEVQNQEGQKVGTITVSAESPSDNKGVALAYVTHPHTRPGTHLHIISDGHAIPAMVADTTGS